MSGRKSDLIWTHFDKIRTKSGVGQRAKCKSCNKEMQGLVARLKKHYEKCLEEVEGLDSTFKPSETDKASSLEITGT